MFLQQKTFGVIILFLAITSFQAAKADDVKCSQLSPPTHGAINATNSNNLYSKITYVCDSGYSVEGPPSRQCLPVPYPNTALWVPDEPTSCIMKDDVTEAMDSPIITFDPTEDEIQQYVSEDSTNSKADLDTEFDSDLDLDIDPDIEYGSDHAVGDSSRKPPPSSLNLSEMDEVFTKAEIDIDRQVPSDTPDKLCILTGDIPTDYKCAGNREKITAYRWLVDEKIGECVKLDLCGDDDEIDINGLFHTHTECSQKCLL